MNTKYAYVDEFGAFGYNFESEGCSTHFIITAIIVDENDISMVKQNVEIIRDKYFHNGEIKSSRIGRDHRKRISILNELKVLPFKIFALVCDKRRIYEQSGLRFKPSFYKFINNLVYQELRTSFSNLVITADEVGENDYLQSFAKYIREREIPLSLFDKSLFRFDNSKDNLIIQVADIIAGSLAYNYDEHKKEKANGNNYISILSSKILMIKEFPQTFENFNIEQNDSNPQYNAQIADICYRKAKFFMETHKGSDELEIKQQLAVLDYLLFRFMNRSPRKYIPTKELINQLCYLGFDRMSIQAFRAKIIAKLRDNEVVISSSPDGYKIPSSEEELEDFINRGKTIILPMLSRLKKCNDIIKLGTSGGIDLFQRAEYQVLANMFKEHNN
jgi:hypothetical protein